MSFQISKNKMSFVADNKQVSKKLTTTTEKVVEKGTTFLLDTINYVASDEIYHATFQFRAHLPNLPMDNFPDGLTVTVNDVLTESCKITTNGDYILGSSAISNTTPITSIKFNVTANPTHHFVFPVDSVLHYGVLPNESQATVANIPTPPPIPVTQYFFMGFGSHWSMGHDTTAGHVTKFTERIALINATLPANEHWALASPSTTEKTNDVLNFFDNSITTLQNHPNANSNGLFTSELLTTYSWTGYNFSAGVSPPIYQGHPVLINLTRDGNGDWSFGDGVSLALSSDRWENTSQSSDNAVMWGNGGSWGGNTKSSNAGKFKIEPATALRLYAIFERTI